MRTEFLPQKIAAYVNNPDRKHEHAVNLNSLLQLPTAQVRRLLEITGDRIEGKRYKTQIGYLHCSVRVFGRYVEARSITSLPIHFQDWQHLVIDLHIWYLSTPRYKAALATRTRSWDQTMSCWLAFLSEEGFLPSGLMIPKSGLPRRVVDLGSSKQPRSLGDFPSVISERTPIGRTMYGPIFWSSDGDALENIQRIMASRDATLAKLLYDYWTRSVRDYRTGKNLNRSKREWKQNRESCQGWKPEANELEEIGGYRPELVTHPSVPDSVGNTIAVLSQILHTSKDVDCLSAKALQSHPAFHTRFAHKRSAIALEKIRSLSALTDHQFEAQTSLTLFMRFLGVLSPLDIAVACAILIREHPNLNPESLITARILNARGRSYLHTTDHGRGQIFSVDKPRAGCRKYATLSPLSVKVLKHIVRCTEPVRKILKGNGSKFWRHLFVGSAGRELGRLEVTAKQLNGGTKYSLSRYYPELEENGLVKGTLDFAKLRATVGMLTWFETGSLTLVSRKLGNSYRVALENYIPKEIRRLWNERVIRRFQNVLILLASADREHNISLSDITSIQDLNSFLAQLTYDFSPGSSVIADEIERKYGTRFRISLGAVASDSKPCSDLLSVIVSPETLSYLYAKRLNWELGIEGSGMLDCLIDLAKLLNFIALKPDVAERMLGAGCGAQLRLAHVAALESISKDHSSQLAREIVASWRQQ